MSNRRANASGSGWGRLLRRGLRRLLRPLLRRFLALGPREAASAYDLWSATYDEEPDNLLVLLDEGLFEDLLRRVEVRGKRVVDVGCGTGRHWNKILAYGPLELVGYDVSPGMLARLRRKHPGAAVHRASAEALSHTAAQSCDLLVSTLALSHVQSVDAVLHEWARVLRDGGDVLLTDFHPAAAAVAETTFVHRGRLITVEKYVHPLPTLEAALRESGFELLGREERVIDESVRHHYVRADKGAVFERMRGTPLLYGMHLRKRGAVRSG
jgi:ubiquinone/menaquinone biosynthesis C-methylase UbiE